jgi:hypothetical protein
MGKNRVREVGVRGISRSLRRSRVPRRPRARVPRLGSSGRRGPVRWASFSFAARRAHAPVPPTWWPRPSPAVPGVRKGAAPRRFFGRGPPNPLVVCGFRTAGWEREPPGSVMLLRESSGGSESATRARRKRGPERSTRNTRRRPAGDESIDADGRAAAGGGIGAPSAAPPVGRRVEAADAAPPTCHAGESGAGGRRAAQPRTSPTAPSSLRRSAKRRGPGSADSSEPFAARKKDIEQANGARRLTGQEANTSGSLAAKRGGGEGARRGRRSGSRPCAPLTSVAHVAVPIADARAVSGDARASRFSMLARQPGFTGRRIFFARSLHHDADADGARTDDDAPPAVGCAADASQASGAREVPLPLIFWQPEARAPPSMNRPNRAPENPRAKTAPSGVGRGTAGRGGGARTAAAVATRTAGSAGREPFRATSKEGAPEPKFGSASAPEQPARRRSSRIEKLRLAATEAAAAAEAKPTAVANCARPPPPKEKKAALDPVEGPAKRLRTAAVADGRPLLRGSAARAPRPLGAAARAPTTAPRPPPRPVHPDLLREQLGRRPGAAFPGPRARPGRTPLSDLTASVASDRQRVSWIPQGGDRWDGVPDGGVGCSPPWSLRIPAPLRNPDLSGLTVGEEDDDDDDEQCPSPSGEAPSLGSEQQRTLDPHPSHHRRDGAPRSAMDSKKRASAAKPPPGGGGGAHQRKPPTPRHALGPGGANKAAPAATRALAPALAADAATNKPRGGTARAPPRQQHPQRGHRGRRGAGRGAGNSGRWPADVLAPPTRVPAAKKGPAAGCCEPGSRPAARDDDDDDAAAARDAENGGAGTSGPGGPAGDAGGPAVPA